MDENSQLLLDIDPAPTFKVGCRVGGDIQVYEVQAVTCRDAAKEVEDGVPGATAIIVRLK